MVDVLGRIRIFLVLNVLGVFGGAFIGIVPANTHHAVLTHAALNIFQVVVSAESHEGAVAVNRPALSVMRTDQSIQNTDQPRTHHRIPAVVAGIGDGHDLGSVRSKFFRYRFNGFNRHTAHFRKIFQRVLIGTFF